MRTGLVRRGGGAQTGQSSSANTVRERHSYQGSLGADVAVSSSRGSSTSPHLRIGDPDASNRRSTSRMRRVPYSGCICLSTTAASPARPVRLLCRLASDGVAEECLVPAFRVHPLPQRQARVRPPERRCYVAHRGPRRQLVHRRQLHFPRIPRRLITWRARQFLAPDHSAASDHPDRAVPAAHERSLPCGRRVGFVLTLRK
jgi:hypothetical protein